MPASRLPAFQFYPGDWRKDPDLQRCTKAEKGFFIDALCLTHECEHRGAFFGNGSAWNQGEIADAVGGDRVENLALLASLISKGPLKVWSKVASKVGLNTSREDLCPDLPDGTIYSRRMLKDEIKRIACSDAGKAGGGNPDLQNQRTFKGDSKGGGKGLPKGAPKRKGGSSSSSSSSNKEIPLTPLSQKILRYWKAKISEDTPTAQTLRNIERLLVSGYDHYDLITSIQRYSEYLEEKAEEGKPPLPYKGSNFFGRAAYFEDYLPAGEEKAELKEKIDRLLEAA